MNHADMLSQTRVVITQSEGGEHLVMTVSNELRCDHHQLSLSQARALSLELIKHTYQAELRNRLSQAEPRQSFAIQFAKQQRA